MATCKKCGENYLSAICPCILNPSYKKNKNKNYLLKAFIVTSGIIGFIGILGIVLYEMYDLKKSIEEKDKEIFTLNRSNDFYRQKINQNENIIDQLRRKNNELARAQTYNKYTQPKQQYIQPKQTTQKKQYIQPKEEQYTLNQQNINKPKIYNQNVYEAPKYTPPKKMYNRYTVAKLVSDSKIEMMADNRLKSNMPIYGRYIEKPVTNIECGKNKRIYKIQNECTGVAFPLDMVYFKKSNANNIQNYNRNTHMVECIYDYENGLMHDCSVKLRG